MKKGGTQCGKHFAMQTANIGMKMDEERERE
jgi:hypothetical protein